MLNPHLLTLFSFLLSAIFSLGISNMVNAQENSWKAPPEAEQQVNPIPADSVSTKKGESLFIQYCSTCHGKEGVGDGPTAIRLITEPPDLTAVEVKQSDGELAWKIATGKNPMPKWNDTLSENEIWDIVNFIRSLQSDAK